jgi:Fe-S-cluster containining protein
MRYFWAMLRTFFGRRQGIAFRCRQCGECCSWPGSVFFTQEEIERAASVCEQSVPEFIDRYRLRYLEWGEWELASARGCPLLDKDKRCRIYQARPLQCASWPFWRSQVKDAAARRELMRECPGCRTGPWYDNHQIEKRVTEDKRNEFF